MTSLSSPLNPLGPLAERWLVGAVIELSSSEVGRPAAAAWMLTYERARALGWDSDEAEACADDAYDSALSEDERAATLCIDNEEDF
jgi:hypothetical protein